MEELYVSAFDIFDKKWALVTAGTENDFNTMTISWGGLGTLWSKPVATVYIKPIRYTHDFLEKNDYFTVSFFTEEHKKDMGVLGSRSGRDGDKISLTSLTPVKVGESMGFREAEVTLLLKKIYSVDLPTENMPAEVIENYYDEELPHTMYVGEVIEIIK